MKASRSANVVGLGLIGGSLCLAMRERGYVIYGTDSDVTSAKQALEQGIIDEIGVNPDAEFSFVAIPVQHVVSTAHDLLQNVSGIVLDVSSVKAPVVAGISNPRFIGTHPMAGSEQHGLDGARADMFREAIWVVTPSEITDPTVHAKVHTLLSELGADVMALEPRIHDEIVAVVSHVPHLTAGALMRIASKRSEQQRVLLRLAAGGFRDMTRIASGHPGIWPDICIENKVAITSVLTELIDELSAVKLSVDGEQRDEIRHQLERARQGRTNLPTTAPRADQLVEIRMTLSDQPGSLSVVTALATEADINIYDIEIAHSPEGGRGVLILVIATGESAAFVATLEHNGFDPLVRELQ